MFVIKMVILALLISIQACIGDETFSNNVMVENDVEDFRSSVVHSDVSYSSESSSIESSSSEPYLDILSSSDMISDESSSEMYESSSLRMNTESSLVFVESSEEIGSPYVSSSAMVTIQSRSDQNFDWVASLDITTDSASAPIDGETNHYLTLAADVFYFVPKDTMTIAHIAEEWTGRLEYTNSTTGETNEILCTGIFYYSSSHWGSGFWAPGKEREDDGCEIINNTLTIMNNGDSITVLGNWEERGTSPIQSIILNNTGIDADGSKVTVVGEIKPPVITYSPGEEIVYGVYRDFFDPAHASFMFKPDGSFEVNTVYGGDGVGKNTGLYSLHANDIEFTISDKEKETLLDVKQGVYLLEKGLGDEQAILQENFEWATGISLDAVENLHYYEVFLEVKSDACFFCEIFE